MKALLRGPMVPLVAIAVMLITYVLTKRRIISSDTFSVWMIITLLVFTAWELWANRDKGKEGRIREEQP